MQGAHTAPSMRDPCMPSLCHCGLNVSHSRSAVSMPLHWVTTPPPRIPSRISTTNHLGDDAIAWALRSTTMTRPSYRQVSCPVP